MLAGTGHIFCAGVDLSRVADGDDSYVRQYIPAFKALMFSLFTVERPLIVAPNAHALAVHDRALLRTGGLQSPILRHSSEGDREQLGVQWPQSTAVQ